MAMRIKTGDRVYVISGKDRGKEGKVLRRDVGKDLVVVENVNMVTKSVRPSQKNPQGGLVKQEAPLRACKVMLVCPACGKPTRVGRAFLDDGRKVRICKKCGEIVDKV
ncbi:50S ribosomal protein L24 [Thermanaerovibrio acidaminovorans]|jgi:large subunit ribosomal protein L24|uniref:Large ribosomal subunit protein uL24 n=1 Tax=Thermanaerovibrio acidaminovorans (strain ATCC 49978 / DSM 6589 / Su883) TaxID=525903 RepID=D1B5W4_THEAS|nr:50S ribosomal protein L24 [Thermanaerovibrio acidaminovorans]ACZ19405.1 ribosomal protein L24 [Thermanaerovibrio acidaminovorans DSM 6589]